MEKFSFFEDIDYFAADFNKYFSMYFTNGIFNNGLLVSANNDMTISVHVGIANINGYQYYNDDIRKLKIENADGVLDRIDNVVIRWDLTNREITAQIIQGDYSEEPEAPELIRNSTIYDLRIAKISIPAGTPTITQDLIEDTRFINSDCGNVICAIETPDTENLYIQLYAKAEKLISDSQKNFENWFKTIQNTLSGDVAGNLANRIYIVEENSKLKTYTTTLTKTSWVLNETTNKYEYDVTKEDITDNHYVTVNPASLEDAEKYSGNGIVNSYNGGFKITATELPEDNINVMVSYQLATDVTPTTPENSEVTE